MNKVTISQNIALMLELLRKLDARTEELAALTDGGSLPQFQQLREEDFNPDTLVEFAVLHPEEFRRAVTEGYEISFNTIGGIGVLLNVKFGLQLDRDFKRETDHLTGIRLSPDDVVSLRAILSRYWAITEAAYDPEQDIKTIGIVMNPPA